MTKISAILYCVITFVFVNQVVVANAQDKSEHRLGIQISPIVGLDYTYLRDSSPYSEPGYGNDYVPLLGITYQLSKDRVHYGTSFTVEPIRLNGFSLDNQHQFKYGKKWWLITVGAGLMYRKNYVGPGTLYHKVVYSSLGSEFSLFNRILIEPSVCYGYIYERDEGFVLPDDRAAYWRGWFRLNLAYLFPLKSK